MNAFKITSDYGHIHFGSFYVGWNNTIGPSFNEKDYGDEYFGLAFGRFYAGLYSDGKWSFGFLNEYGCLD